jgi:hypothetical protein
MDNRLPKELYIDDTYTKKEKLYVDDKDKSGHSKVYALTDRKKERPLGIMKTVLHDGKLKIRLSALPVSQAPVETKVAPAVKAESATAPPVKAESVAAPHVKAESVAAPRESTEAEVVVDGTPINQLVKAELPAPEAPSRNGWNDDNLGLEDDTEEVVIKETLEQGDCFYSSIFRSSRERGLLEKIAECLSLDSSSEMVFVETFRNKLADSISKGNLQYTHERNGNIDTYDYLVGLTGNSGTYHQVTHSYPGWFNEEFGVGGDKLGDRDSFCQRLAAHIRQLGEWVGEIEVRIITEWLEGCNIKLEVRSNKETNLYKTSQGMDVLHLYNPSERHFEYFSFEPEVGERESEVSRSGEVVPVVSAVEPKITDDRVDQGESSNMDRIEISSEKSMDDNTNCLELYHPCTRQRISSLQELENAIREIKKDKMKELSEAMKWPSNISNRLDLLQYILNMDKHIDESFFKYSINGQIYEALWDIVIALGYTVNHEGKSTFEKTPEFRISLEKLDGKSDLDVEQLKSDGIEYLEKREVNMGASGSSDITFAYIGKKPDITDRDPCSVATEENKVSKSIYFCSSKFFKDDASKSAIGDLDIPKIFISAKNIDNTYKKNIIILVKDRDIINSKLKRALHKEISEEATCVLGMKELFASLKKIYDINVFKNSRDNSIEITKEDIKNYFQVKGSDGKIINPKSLQLRMHQMMSVDKITDSIKEFNKADKTTVLNNKFLIGILPRGGKTYIAGGIVRDTQFKTIVVILGAKSETLDQFKDDLFDVKTRGMSDFKDYDVIDVKDHDVNFQFDPLKKYILIMSAELFKMPDDYIRLTEYSKKNPAADNDQLIQYIQSVYNFKVRKEEKTDIAKKIVNDWILKGRPEMKRKFLRELQGKVTGGRRADLFICDEAHLKQVTHNAVKAMTGATVVAENPGTEEDEDIEEITEEGEIEEIKREVDKVSNDIPIVYMTGTYFKPLKAFRPPPSQVALWVYEDIEMAKNLRENEQYFIDKFGKYYTQALERCLSYNQTYESIQLTYERFPRLNLITTSFTKEAKDAFEEQRAEGRGFSTMPQLFKLKDTKWKATNGNVNSWYDQFNNTNGMIRLINYLSPEYTHVKHIKKSNDPGKEGEPVLSINSALSSVDIIAQRHGDRLRLFTSEFKIHTQLWFLPKVSRSGTVDQRMCALAGCIFQNKWFRKYFVVLGVSSSGKWDISNSKGNRVNISPMDGSENDKDLGEFTWACPSSTTPSLKKCILEIERDARKRKKGLIILAQDMLHLGISLECVDIVVLLDDSKNIDERIQKMYRALTESYSDDTIFKRAGFIIDMNYFRTVNALVDYQIIATKNKAVDRPTQQDTNDAIRKTLSLYAVNNDGSVLQSQIENETIIELTGRKSSHLGSIQAAGDKLDENINKFLENRYVSSYNNLLQEVDEEKQPEKRAIRENTSGVEHAVELGEAKKGSRAKREDILRELFNTKLDEKQRSEAFKNSIRTTLKLGIFGSDKDSADELLELVTGDTEESNDFRDILYDTLIKRGDILPPTTQSKEELFENSMFYKNKPKMERNRKTIKKNNSGNPLMNDTTVKQRIKQIYTSIIKDISDNKGYNTHTYLEGKRRKGGVLEDFPNSTELLLPIVSSLQSEYMALSESDKDAVNNKLNLEEETIEENDEDDDEDSKLSFSIKLKSTLTDILWNKLSEEERNVYERLEKESIDKETEFKNKVFKTMIIPELEEISKSTNKESYSEMKREYGIQSENNEKFADVLKYIVEHLAPKDAERHKFGEVFTPLELVDEMLSKLPQEGSDNVWNKKEWKWLDPANGIGNFPIKAILGQTDGVYESSNPYFNGKKRFAYPGLLKGLRSKFDSDETCLKHIIENMLFMVDINPKNNQIAKNLLHKLCPSAKANISKIGKNGYLTDGTVLDFGNGKKIKEFHIIIGNPPYQSGAVKSVGTTLTRKIKEESGFTGDLNKNLWIPFVNTALDKFLVKSGYLLFIHPIGWFKPDGLAPQTALHNKMLEKQIIHMKIYKNHDAAKLFGGKGAISLSYYLLQNKNNVEPTTIVDMVDNTDNIRLNSESVIILAYNSIFNKIRNKCKLFKDTTDYMQTQLGNAKCSNSGEYNNIVSVTEDGKVLLVKSSVELKKKDISINNMPKIFIDGIKYPRILYDKKGEYGIIGQNQHYLVGDNLDRQEDFFKTKLSALLLTYIKFRQDFIEPRYYPDVRLLKDEDGKEVEITDSSLAKVFKFTPKEINAIDDYAKSIGFDPNKKYVHTQITCEQMGKRIKDETKGDTKKGRAKKAKKGGLRNITRRKSRN